MPDGGLERRLERIEERQDSMLETLAVIREKVTQTNGSVADLVAEVGRVPKIETRQGRLPITDRLHTIEAVVSPVSMSAALTSALDERRGATWTRTQKVVTMVGVAIAAGTSILHALGIG